MHAVTRDDLWVEPTPRGRSRPRPPGRCSWGSASPSSFPSFFTAASPPEPHPPPSILSPVHTSSNPTPTPTSTEAQRQRPRRGVSIPRVWKPRPDRCLDLKKPHVRRPRVRCSSIVAFRLYSSSEQNPFPGKSTHMNQTKAEKLWQKLGGGALCPQAGPAVPLRHQANTPGADPEIGVRSQKTPRKAPRGPGPPQLPPGHPSGRPATPLSCSLVSWSPPSSPQLPPGLPSAAPWSHPWSPPATPQMSPGCPLATLRPPPPRPSC